tara:strand:- start:40 stop:1203 length:1164 start_codon:yes stop_codon:yes gene_type:complete
MGGGLIPVIGRQTNGQIISQELGEADVVSNPMVVEGGYAEPISMPVPEVAIEDDDIESSIPQTVIGEAAFGAGMYPELADQQGNLYAQQSSPLAEQEGRWDASWPSPMSGFTFETPYTGKVGPFLTGTGVVSGLGKSVISRALPGIGSKIAPMVTPAVKAMMGEKVTGKDWTFAGLGLLASFFFPALMPILGLISFVTDLMSPSKTEPESVLQEGVDLPGLAGPIELATSGLGLGITPDVFYNDYAEPGNPYTVINENVDFGHFVHPDIATALESIGLTTSYDPMPVESGYVEPDFSYDPMPVESGYVLPDTGLTSVTLEPYSTSLPDHLYGDQAKDFFDMSEAEVTQLFETGFAPGPYTGDVDFNFAGDFGPEPEVDASIYGAEGN